MKHGSWLHLIIDQYILVVVIMDTNIINLLTYLNDKKVCEFILNYYYCTD